MRTDTAGTVPGRTSGCLDPQRRAELDDIMAAAADDPSAPWDLLNGFGDQIAANLRRLARADGLRLDADEIEGLTADACLEIVAVARTWRPDGGALPWTYARGRLRALLHRHAGPALAALPDVEPADPRNWGAAAPADDEPSLAVLGRVAAAAGEPAVVALERALAVICSPADAELVLRYLQHKAAGDPSPSHTVGAQLGRRPDAVRQAYHRARTRLRRLALADHRFRPLLCLPFLADHPSTDAGRAA
jgi:DNA-directed RNA polymerase specialized sigma24 family protein